MAKLKKKKEKKEERFKTFPIRLLTVNLALLAFIFFLLTFYFCLFSVKKTCSAYSYIPSRYLVLLCLSLRSQWFLFNLCNFKTLITIVRYDLFSNALPYFTLCSFYIFWVSPTVLSVTLCLECFRRSNKSAVFVCRWICVNKECWSFVFDIYTNKCGNHCTYKSRCQTLMLLQQQSVMKLIIVYTSSSFFISKNV